MFVRVDKDMDLVKKVVPSWVPKISGAAVYQGPRKRPILTPIIYRGAYIYMIVCIQIKRLAAWITKTEVSLAQLVLTESRARVGSVALERRV